MRHSDGVFLCQLLYMSSCSSFGTYFITATSTMNNSDPLALSPFNSSSLTIMKEIIQTCKASSMQKLMQVVHRAAQKSCRTACQLFCCPLGTLFCEKGSYCPGQNREPTEQKTTQVAIRHPPSTILIVNISNSTLIDCVIGNDTYPSVMAESQPLIQQPELQMHDCAGCGCSRVQQWEAQTCPPPPPPSAEPPSLNIHSSHLNYVIIGDNNYMHAEQTHLTEPEELQV